MLSEAQQLHARYSQELSGYKAQLQDLKANFFKRQIDKGRLQPATDHLKSLSLPADPNNPQHEEALIKLQRLVARALLDPACQAGITAADTLHKKVRTGVAVGMEMGMLQAYLTGFHAGSGVYN